MTAQMRAEARRIFAAGVAAADPYIAVRNHLDRIDPPELILAVGKAAMRMAEAALTQFAGTKCIVVTNYENAGSLEGATVFAAGHPVPDENGVRAADAVIAALRQARGPVLALISGGGSALLPAPAGDLTLADKAAVSTALLGAGLDIGAMNLVRQQLSRLKGGGLLREAAPAPVTALILSDVIGDDLAVIASGPTVAPIGTAQEAVALLKTSGLWQTVPDAVRHHLETVREVSSPPAAHNILIGSNAMSLAAMQRAAPQAHVLPRPVTGDVAEAARTICEQARPGITLWGGETTVVLHGTGKGGRNQELGLRIAQGAAERGWNRFVCLQGGSDGRDGPTDAAGALVDDGTLARVGDADAYLARNDSYAALARAHDLLMTGATGTNVADLGVLIRPI